jgi:hypothetical protein
LDIRRVQRPPNKASSAADCPFHKKAKNGGGKSYWTFEIACANPVAASHSANWKRLIQHTNEWNGIMDNELTDIPATDTNGVPSSTRI